MEKDGFTVKADESFLGELQLMSTFAEITKLSETFPSQSLLECFSL